MNKKQAGPKPPKTTTGKRVIGSDTEQELFGQPSIGRAREINERLLLELESRGVSIDPRTGEVTIKIPNDLLEPKS